MELNEEQNDQIQLPIYEPYFISNSTILEYEKQGS